MYNNLSTNYHYVTVDFIPIKKYRKLTDSINLQLYDMAHNRCNGCTHIDSKIRLCSIFSFTYKNLVSSLKLFISNCPCQYCLVKMRCDRICNEFIQFYTNHKTTITGITYHTDAIKTSLNIVIYTNKVNRINHDMVFEIKGLRIDNMVSHKDHKFQSHFFRSLIR
jgi:hypothetical protein